MDKKAYLAIGLSLAIWVVWQKVYLEPIQLAAEQHRKQQQELLAKQVPPVTPSAAPSATTAAPIAAPSPAKGDATPKSAELDNGSSQVKVSNEPFAIQGWQLKAIPRSLESKDERVDLGLATGFHGQVRVRFSEPAQAKPNELDRMWTTLQGKGLESESRVDTASVQASRSFRLDDSGFGGRFRYQFHFQGTPPKFIFLDLFGSPKRASDQEGSIFGQAPDKVHVTFRDLNGRTSEMGANLKDKVESGAGVRWLGLDTRYFVMALVPVLDGAGSDVGAQIAHDVVGPEPAVRGSLVFPTQGKQSATIDVKVYFGPKEMAALNQVDPVLSDAIDFGWTSFIAIPLLQSLKWLYSLMHNWGLAIIVLTFLIKMLLFPLMYKSMTSMAKMSRLQPQLNALREKYKDDKEKLNVEMMSFMKANGYNPVSGCLPILLQMPIFFALYRVLFNSMELYQAPFAGWIHDLSSPDPFFVTPVLLTGLMYLQQKLSPNTAADPAQQKMLQIMPVMFGAFMLMLPSGLTIYMVVNSAVSIVQQVFLNRKLGIHPAVAKPAAAKA